MLQKSRSESDDGGASSENADMSSDKFRKSLNRRKPKVSWGRFDLPGLVGI